MSKLDNERKLVVERVKKFEKTAREIHVMANKLHKKMDKLRHETIATRERARKPAKKPMTRKLTPGRQLSKESGESARTALQGALITLKQI